MDQIEVNPGDQKIDYSGSILYAEGIAENFAVAIYDPTARKTTLTVSVGPELSTVNDCLDFAIRNSPDFSKLEILIAGGVRTNKPRDQSYEGVESCDPDDQDLHFEYGLQPQEDLNELCKMNWEAIMRQNHYGLRANQIQYVGQDLRDGEIKVEVDPRKNKPTAQHFLGIHEQ